MRLLIEIILTFLALMGWGWVWVQNTIITEQADTLDLLSKQNWEAKRGPALANAGRDKTGWRPAERKPS